jgi:hypothetical protein
LAESVASGRCRGESEPELRSDPFHRMLVRGRAEVVAFVDDDVAVPDCEFSDVVTSGEGTSVRWPWTARRPKAHRPEEGKYGMSGWH